MSSGKVTSLDVAEAAGVSRSAVSRVFTPGASVSEKTARKVRAAAADLGYRPNALARSLLTGRSRMIGLVVAYLDNHFYPRALEQLSASLEKQGYHVLVFMASHTEGNVDHVVREILDYQVDGLVLMSVSLTSDLAQLCRQNDVPVVLFNRRLGDAGELAVVSDNQRGGQMAAQHFADIGLERVGYIAGWHAASTQNDREAGFRVECAKLGLELVAVEDGEFNPDRAHAATLKMFGRPDRPQGVFVANDYMAFTVMDALRGPLGLKVPDDVCVIGFDDVPTAAWRSYDLTTLRQNSQGMVDETVALLMAAVQGQAVIAPVPLNVELVVRGSSSRI
ncbi:LacI family DNA-binding transcriptional regulator [Algirhabdus cladophorae]|uniref:LacI family DNA-binding transcriptional regulator n=1 Tax=Algirhabdus cladophorae TaxID=3377108 RepID=UPI003B847463